MSAGWPALRVFVRYSVIQMQGNVHGSGRGGEDMAALARIFSSRCGST